MRHKSDEFNLMVVGYSLNEELSVSGWNLTKRMSIEASKYLRQQGYNSRVNLPSGEFGATGASIFDYLLEGIPKLVPFLRIILLLVKTFSDKYSRSLIQNTDQKTHMNIVLSYESDAVQWIRSWSLIAEKAKVQTMLEAAGNLHEYLSNKYRSMSFSIEVRFHFTKGSASQSFSLESDEVSAFNLARMKKVTLQTSYEKDTVKEFRISKKLFLKRTDKRWGIVHKKYYLILPSPLIAELVSNYRLLKYKVSEEAS